jgi:hypothetical protein
MKKKFVLIFTLGIAATSFAQDFTDALRYSMDNIQGTARFRAMGGAFGALGGDFSAVSLNPAGSAVFVTSQAGFTLSMLNNKNETQYFNGFTSETDSKFDLNQGGAVFVFQNTNSNSGWSKFTLGIGYDKTGDFNNNWSAIGTNTRSIDRYFLAYADGRRLDEISVLPGETFSEAYRDIGQTFGFGHQQAFLGFESFIIDPVVDTDDNTSYVSNIAAGNFNQQNILNSRGYNGKFTFNFAGQYRDHLYIGANINTHFLNYERSTFFSETNNNQGSLVNSVQFENNLFTTGAGFSFQLGTILKLSDGMRLGFTYDSPTWFRINEETSQAIRTVRNDNGSNVSLIIDPNVINVYEAYNLKSPGRITASVAYVFGSSGLISFDFSRKDYSNAEFRPTSDSFFRTQNELIRRNLTVSNTLRVGGEYRIKQATLRGGYRFEGSPYSDNTTFMGDLNAYSLGFGYNFGNFKLDLAYEYTNRLFGEQLFSVGLTDQAFVDATNNNIFMTLTFNL